MTKCTNCVKKNKSMVYNRKYVQNLEKIDIERTFIVDYVQMIKWGNSGHRRNMNVTDMSWI